MRFLFRAVSVVPFVLLFSFACDDAGGEGDGGGGEAGGDSDQPTAWLGNTPHVQLAGTVAEQQLELVADEAEASGVGTAYCERNYIVPDVGDPSTFDEAYLQKVEIKFNFFHNDALAEFQMELEKPDLLSEVGAMLVAGDDAEVALGIKVDEEGPQAEEFEDEAVGGTVALELLSGEPDDSGVIIASGDGKYGAYVDLELASGGRLQGSFTVQCADNDLETPER